jgi:hypothetical protein
MLPGVNDRVVRITAEDVEQLMRAVALIITKLSENPSYFRHMNHALSYASGNFAGNTNGGAGGGRHGRGGEEQVRARRPRRTAGGGEPGVAPPDGAVVKKVMSGL